ncbi:hypothetical protein CBS101457_000195 [Exobasidium rhododendri]|nr:hypothetical protein CBS101457_000195 [Exobasidium rhododendri]
MDERHDQYSPYGNSGSQYAAQQYTSPSYGGEYGTDYGLGTQYGQQATSSLFDYGTDLQQSLPSLEHSNYYYQHATEEQPGADYGETVTPTYQGGSTSHLPAHPSEPVVPTPIPYPSEYTFKLKTNIKLAKSPPALFRSLPEDHKTYLVDLVTSIRPYNSIRAASRLSYVMDADTAKALLSNDEERANRAATKLFPDIDPDSTPNRFIASWMTGLEYWERKEAIRRLAEVTDQPADKIRDYVLAHKIHDFPRQVLDATSAEEVWQVAEECGLIMPAEPDLIVRKSEKPWQKGLSKIQKAALHQRMLSHITTFGLPERITYSWLTKNKVPAGYGKKMLRVDEDTFTDIMLVLSHASKSKNLQMKLPFTR